MRALRLLFFLCFVAFLSCQQKFDLVSDAILETKLDSVFKATPDFSGVVLVARKGVPVYHKAFGFRNFETQEPLDTASIFELASVSKQFTAMTIMMLQEEGKLQYDDAIEKYIPGLPYPGITIRHLLNHTSGLPDYQAVMDQHWDKTKVAGNDDNIEYLKLYRPAKHFEPGDKYEYSNTGYMLLASIAEKTSGKDFIAFCHERIFTPLAMSSTGIRTKAEKQALPNMAWGHLYVAEKQRYVPADSFPAFNYAIWLGNRKGPGRVSSTAADLLKWDQALYSEKLVKEETLQQAFSAATLNSGKSSAYGFGWMIGEDTGSGAVVMHTGDNPGYKTKIVRYLDQNRTVIVLCNNAHPRYGEIVNVIEQLVAGH
ncbi:beta-lactamase family protein [Fulvivirgaceae bacterium PWU4]|uniref:Beta-lactamase family protein n=1 Tax=Chryseosolibacter histidini TaxID=2782349 RepID=A0AAP2GNU6_9BACT|nr:serine hydrolase domain-containing protein [Chryseosolibacter histidini]MBT1696862.1 beta-lactamase family protein [Chryseosolibacter histidini]